MGSYQCSIDQPAGDLGATLDTQYLLGLGAVSECMIILAEIEKLMSSRDTNGSKR